MPFLDSFLDKNFLKLIIAEINSDDQSRRTTKKTQHQKLSLNTWSKSENSNIVLDLIISLEFHEGIQNPGFLLIEP